MTEQQPKFEIGQRVKIAHYEVIREEECKHCGSLVDIEEKVWKEYTINTIWAEYRAGAGEGFAVPYYTYGFGDSTHASYEESRLEAVEA